MPISTNAPMTIASQRFRLDFAGVNVRDGASILMSAFPLQQRQDGSVATRRCGGSVPYWPLSLSVSMQYRDWNGAQARNEARDDSAGAGRPVDGAGNRRSAEPIGRLLDESGLAI